MTIMQEKSTEYFVGLDIGTSSVRCVVGTTDSQTGAISVIGHGVSTNNGMRKGVVTHIDDTVDALLGAVSEAERIAGVRISHATVNINGTHVVGMSSKGVIAVSGANREITTEDRDRVEEAAAILKLPANREIIQVFARNYRLDGQDNIKDPVGMHGVRLEVDCHIITAATPNIHNLDQVFEKAEIRPRHRTTSALAAAEAVLDRKQKEAGAAVIDIGAGTTNIAVIEDGEIQHVAVVPMGSMHVTNDLAIGLKTDLEVAEQVKLKHVQLGDTTDKTFRVLVDGAGYTFEQSEATMIAEARVEELLEYVDKELAKIHRSRKLPGGIVIVGGGAALPGLAEFAREKLQLPVRIGKIRGLEGLADTVDDPAFATATGLMMLDILLNPYLQNNGHDDVPAQFFANGMKSVKKFFEHFKDNGQD